MKPKHFTRARKYVGKKMYLRLRAWRNRKLFSFLDKMLISCPIKDVPIYCNEMERYAKKEAYYENKLKDGQRDKEESLG